MSLKRCGAAALLFLPVMTSAGEGQATGAPPADTIRVAAPASVKDSDRASIIAALERAGAGDVVQFAPGTYVVGELISVTTSHVTLLGHPDGTTLRGCAPEDFVDADVALFACNGLELAGSHQTVRNLTFEYAWHGLFVGCCFPADMAAAEAGTSHRAEQPGGHIIEGNTFRNSSNGLRVIGQSAVPIVIRGNRFVNTFHALAINGGAAHVLGNDVSAPEPERVPIAGHTGYALTVAPTPPNAACGRNVIAGNRVEGHTDAIMVKLFVPGTRCRGTVIRDNTIVTRKLRYATAWGVRMGSPGDSGLHGVPIAITNVVDDVAADLPASLRRDGASVLDSTIVDGNTIIGGSGLGIEVLRSSGNRLANNTITGITRRDPFPGNTANSTDPETSGWQRANGAGIWISPGSDRNDVAGNRFSDVAAQHVVLEGDSNVVESVSPSAVLDLGTANRVVGTDQERAQQEPAGLLYVWMGDVDRDPDTGELGPGQDSDFLAVYDVDPGSPSYGDVVATLPVGLTGSLPHHTEYEMPPIGQPLFANAHIAEDVLLFDLDDPLNPRIAGVLEPVPPLRYPHDMVALPNGNVLVGHLRSEGPSPVLDDTQTPGGHGGIAEFTRAGELVRWASAAVDSLTEPVRPYSFAMLPEIDRLVVSSSFMMERSSADVIQVWRLSDLTLLHTLPVPPARLTDGSLLRTRNPETGALAPTGHVGPAVLHVAHDGSVLFSTFGCGVYRITGLDGDGPRVENVHTFDVPPDTGIGDCGIPVQTGRYWVMPIGEMNALVSLDFSNPAEPRRIAELNTGVDFEPHWLAIDRGSNRLIVGAQDAGEDRMLMARLDPVTGELSWDETLRARNGFPGIDFRRLRWPHGATGLAFAHAALFGRKSP